MYMWKLVSSFWQYDKIYIFVAQMQVMKKQQSNVII